MSNRVVFCDFDGTITASETFVGMLERFVPELWAALEPDIYGLNIPLRQAVKQLVGSIPTQRYPEILEYMRGQPLRPGLLELLDFLEGKRIPFVVVSSGLRGMVEATLGSLKHRAAAIFAADVDETAEFLRVYSEWEGEIELVEKARILRGFGAAETIAIGDSITDLGIAKEASLVFAKDPLCRYLDERAISYIPWQDFHEVRIHLSQRWGDDAG